MQNDFKYGKISELCGINMATLREKKEKNCACSAQKCSPAWKEIHMYFYGGGGKNSTFSKNILPCFFEPGYNVLAIRFRSRRI